MIKPEADIILAIHKVKKDLKRLLPCKHVYAHQDTRKMMETAEKKTKPRMQLDCKAEVDYRENMVRTQGSAEEIMSVSEGSSSDDYNVATSSDEEDTRDS